MKVNSCPSKNRRGAVASKSDFDKNSGFKYVASGMKLVCLVAALAILFLAPHASAQLYTGTLSGEVTDPSGASIPGAKVTLVDQDKGFTLTSTTDPTGRYLFRSVSPGTYRISVEAASFQSQRQDGVKVEVTQNVSIDFKLVIGASNDTVEVQANTVQLQTEDAVTGQVVNRKFVNDLPLIDRNFTNLAFLAPGISETSDIDIHDGAGHDLVTSYAVLRPDGEWSVMLVNKDQENSHAAHIVFQDQKSGKESHFSGSASMVTFGSEQYRWHSNLKGGTADPDGPAARSTISADADTAFALPKASVTVIRGKLASNEAPAKPHK